MSLSLEEQETHINFSRGDSRAMIYTSDTTMVTKLHKLECLEGTEWKLEEVYRLENGEEVGRTYSCPVSFISFRSKRVKREYTEEQKRQAADRLRKGRSGLPGR